MTYASWEMDICRRAVTNDDRIDKIVSEVKKIYNICNNRNYTIQCLNLRRNSVEKIVNKNTGDRNEFVQSNVIKAKLLSARKIMRAQPFEKPLWSR